VVWVGHGLAGVWLCHVWVLIGRGLHVTSEAAFVAVELLQVVTAGAVALVVEH